MADQHLPVQEIERLSAAIDSGDPSRAMPALAGLRAVAAEQAIPLLLLGLQQETFMIRSLSCAGLGYKQSEAGWAALAQALQHDDDPNVRAEAANALVSYGPERAWPLVREAFEANSHWLLRCSILSALAELPDLPRDWLLDLALMAVADPDGTVRVGGAEILGRLVREGSQPSSSPAISAEARAALGQLQHDSDHRVVAAVLNGLRP